MIADQLEVRALRRTLERLERAHTETIEWLMTRLAEVAAGGPAALRPTPMQSIVGFGRRLSTMSLRNASGTVNRSIEDAGRVRRQAVDAVRTNGGRVQELIEAAGESGPPVRRQPKRTEEIADERGDRTQARAIQQRRPLGAVDATELPIRGYDALRADVATARIARLTNVDDVRAVFATNLRTRPARASSRLPAHTSSTSLRGSPPPPDPTEKRSVGLRSRQEPRPTDPACSPFHRASLSSTRSEHGIRRHPSVEPDRPTVPSTGERLGVR